ncbi:DNA repair protein RadA-like [Rhodamnia argentea]|uniref:DNA repair protein RadA-like n=1 Tax=Rhodamnia argentea TaxID=178133 RepID=A0ABM3HSK9_9MYRT|nr:DNA repair protein RadA-like [Rhodamnia argentea]
MRALRTLCTHKQLLNPTTKPTSLAFFKPIQIAHPYRSIHSTNHRLLSQNPSLASLFSSFKSETSGTAHTVDDSYDPANRCVRSSDREAGSGPESGTRSGDGEISEKRRHFGGGRSSYSGSSKKGRTRKQFTVEENGGGSEKVRGFEEPENVVRTWQLRRDGEVRPLRLTDVNSGLNQSDRRIPLDGPFGEKVSSVLGGGLVPGSLILVGGNPGVGKSTLLLQMAAMLAEGHDLGRSAPVVCVSGEESVEQIRSRADRLGITTEELYLYSSTDIEDILEKVKDLSPRALFVDSIQTVYLKEVAGSAGGLSQVKECALALHRLAKEMNIPVILTGHVTKSEAIAGPRVLQHTVDVILNLKEEKHFTYRLLQSVKNRFGSTDEVGVFKMSQSGLEAVLNPSEILSSQEYSKSGEAAAVVMDGSRSSLLKIQALCIPLPRLRISRQVNGIKRSRVDMIIAVLLKQAGLKLQGNAIFLDVVGGVTPTETSGDLAIAAAVCSSYINFPIPSGVAFIGEIGLGGELHVVPGMKKRVNTVAKLGYRMCIIPKSAENDLADSAFDGLVIVGCRNLKEVINTVFPPYNDQGDIGCMKMNRDVVEMPVFYMQAVKLKLGFEASGTSIEVLGPTSMDPSLALMELGKH